MRCRRCFCWRETATASLGITPALPLYEQVIKKYPDSTYAKEAQYQRLVGLYYADSTALIPEIDKYLAANPASDKNSQITLLKAESLYRKQKYAEAIPVYASLQGSTLTDDLMADAEFKLGWCQMQTKALSMRSRPVHAFLLAYPKNKLVPSAISPSARSPTSRTGDFTDALKDFDTLMIMITPRRRNANLPSSKRR